VRQQLRIRPVVRFLELLEANQVEEAVDLRAADVIYENVGLPTLYGRERVRQAFQRAMRLPGAGFQVYFHKVATALTVHP
jgi:limonene-1,2-epoxide hydrolase